eukprot:CAMPEP_0173408312 /NCGR_PEP_ID=MMETSP1356-20130122/69402_1 /TAXON_ID=77927 ORGANISM="Hemiselmis virescens, Strain PCC157" /NCGR_SAMPLE_ID=MMETSP1356 /ASSEMBLY_ACC=CAM_ASM_000847 /LENGTH=32 /DNA_ID= /DNA_START= /DNA_END= /DNA_ORIENTATION=
MPPQRAKRVVKKQNGGVRGLGGLFRSLVGGKK